MIEGVHNTKELHHAYLFEGEQESILAELLDFLEKKLRVACRGNPDVHVRMGETLTIEESRALKNLASQQAVGTAPKFFIVAFSAATREAQNSLLKLFEDPTPRTHFFMIVPSAELLLPTLRSRLQHARTLREASGNESLEEAKTFLASSPAARLELVKDIVDTKDKLRALQLLDALERTLYERVPIERMGAMDREALSKLTTLRSYLRDRAPSVKQILEHVALTLPSHT